MAEKLHSNFNLNIIKIRIIFEFKGIISVRGKKAFGFSPEATRGRIEQNITNSLLLKA